MDFIVANDVTVPGAGFQTDTNLITILDRQGNVETFPLLEKLAVADLILDRLKRLRDAGRVSDGG